MEDLRVLVTIYIPFFDGTHSGASSLRKVCRYDNPGTFTTTSSQSSVVFRGFHDLNRPAGRVGVRVAYRSVPRVESNICATNNGGCQHSCVNNGDGNYWNVK